MYSDAIISTACPCTHLHVQLPSSRAGHVCALTFLTFLSQQRRAIPRLMFRLLVRDALRTTRFLGSKQYFVPCVSNHYQLEKRCPQVHLFREIIKCVFCWGLVQKDMTSPTSLHNFRNPPGMVWRLCWRYPHQYPGTSTGIYLYPGCETSHADPAELSGTGNTRLNTPGERKPLPYRTQHPKVPVGKMYSLCAT